MSLHGGRELVRGPQRHDSRSVIGDRGFRGDIARHHASAVRGQYHWYTYGRHRYCHYWDHNGYRWWGFYIGVGAGVAAAFFWTRWYEDRFWWYEPRWGRWCYYDEYDGYWHYRWNDADYLYDDGTYYRYEQTPTGVRLVPVQPAGQPADTEIPSPQADPNASTFCASNMSACVVISGPDRRAVLTTGDGVLVSELTQAVGVEDVDFSDPNAGPLEIVLTLSGGRVLIFNGRGQLLNPGPQGGLETPRFGELHERLDGITPAGLHSVLNSR
ncbi:MAG: hypothetical protein HY059_09595 [Proteobacteria bacterium]|nr:hypothetical protein [Pseudomonadota bacterium]